MVKRRNRVYMPMGVGGLLRYPEEEEELIKLKPKHVIYFAIGLIIFEIILKVLFF